MDRAPSPAAAGELRPPDQPRPAGRALWGGIWGAFALVVTVGVVEYLTVVMGAVVPLWLWMTVGGALVLWAAWVAVFVDVVQARRVRGRRPVDVVARLLASAIVVLWVVLLVWLLERDRVVVETQMPDPTPPWLWLLVQVPVVPHLLLTLVGLLARRAGRAPSGP